MGIKHLEKVRDILRNNKQDSFAITRLKMDIRVDSRTINEIIDYLKTTEKSIKFVKGKDGIKRIKWK